MDLRRASRRPPGNHPRRPESNRDAVRGGARDGDVGIAVGIEVGDDDRSRHAAGREMGGLKLSSPSPSRIVTSGESWLATARSAFPSRFRSATASDRGPIVTGTLEARRNPPTPSPSRIESSLESPLATARSTFRSLLKSATATECGWLPTSTGDPSAKPNLPAPSPSRIATRSSQLGTARSMSPSPFRSAAVMPRGWPSDPVGEPGAALKPPAPSPRRIKIASELVFVTARSVFPSSSKSATATAHGPSPAATGEPAASANRPRPFPSRIATLPSRFSATMSVLASPLKSAVAIQIGGPPSGIGAPGTKRRVATPGGCYEEEGEQQGGCGEDAPTTRTASRDPDVACSPSVVRAHGTLRFRLLQCFIPAAGVRIGDGS